MNKHLKKIEYQELFLSELRNNYFGEKKLEESIREMETKENMKKLAQALKNIWKQTEENAKDLEKAFPKSEINKVSAPLPITKEQVEVPIITEKAYNKPKKVILDSDINKKDVKTEADLPAYQILTYDNLVELVDDLNTEQITEILESASSSEGNNHQYLAKVAEKLVRERDSKA